MEGVSENGSIATRDASIATKDALIYFGIPAATTVMTATTVGLLMGSKLSFVLGLIAGTATSSTATYLYKSQITDIAMEIRSDYLNEPEVVAGLSVWAGYTVALTAFVVGYFVLPRLVAFGSGVTAGLPLGVASVYSTQYLLSVQGDHQGVEQEEAYLE